MKLIVSGIIIFGLSMSGQVKAETTVIKAKQKHTGELAFLNNYDSKIAALENYTVTYVSAKERARALKNQPANGVDVKLVKKASKS
jgi:hypothetical protein